MHFWKKLPFVAQMISNMYSFDPDIAQSTLTQVTPTQHVIIVSIISKLTEKSEKNNISRIGRSILVILSCVIYLAYILHDKNIPGMISGRGHVMRLSQGQM